MNFSRRGALMRGVGFSILRCSFVMVRTRLKHKLKQWHLFRVHHARAQDRRFVTTNHRSQSAEHRETHTQSVVEFPCPQWRSSTPSKAKQMNSPPTSAAKWTPQNKKVNILGIARGVEADGSSVFRKEGREGGWDETFCDDYDTGCQ